MSHRIWVPVTACAVALFGLVAREHPAAAQGAGRVEGRVKLTATPPANVPIRMNWDVNCLKINAGKRVVQETVLRSADGGLANVFVYVDGTFPQTEPPAAMPEIDQEGCVYHPRVTGARVGQTIEIKNSDPTIHNVHSMTSKDNTFNTTLSQAGTSMKFRLKSEEAMLQIKCDVHSWMIGYVGVVRHGYFAVTDADGGFRIPGVPAGKYTVRAWHEQYGWQSLPVEVKGTGPTQADFTYAGTEKAGIGKGLPLARVTVHDSTTRATRIELLPPLR